MTDRSAEHWYPTAAYLYVLHLDGPALAWEYLRRNPDYRRDWLRRRRRPDTAQAWGLRLLEDPALDARDAHPAWFPDHDAVVQVYPDDDPPPEAHAFEFWRVPGRQAPGAGVALARLLPAARARAGPGRRHGLPLRHPRLRHALRALSHARVRAGRIGRGHGCHACGGGPFQAHDGRGAGTAHLADARRLAGASLREVAEGLFGADAVAADWHKDSALRARVRRLVRRGDALMRGGYRRLAQLPPPLQ